MTQLDLIKLNVKLFEKAQKDYSKQGAQDTEPDTLFQKLLVLAFCGQKPQVPADAEGWDLYTDTPGADAAAAALYSAARACVGAVEATVVKDAPEVEKYLRDRCWRITLAWRHKK